MFDRSVIMLVFLSAISLFSNANAECSVTRYTKPHEVQSYSLDESSKVNVHNLNGCQIVEIILKKSQVTFHVKDTRQDGAANDIFKNNAEEKSLVLVNGGFFGYENNTKKSPIGLVRSDSVRKNPLIAWTSGGVLVGNDEDVSIILAKYASGAGKWKEAIQSKPVIILNNKIDVVLNRHDAPFNRVAIGTGTNDEILIVGAFHSFGEAYTQLQFAKLYAEVAKNNQIEITRAMSMGGSAGAHIYIPGLNLQFGYGGIVFVPNIVDFRKK